MEGFVANKIIKEIKQRPKMKIQKKQQMTGRQFSSFGQNINLKTMNIQHLKNWTLSYKYFFCEVHKSNGKEYKPSSLPNMQRANR